MNGSRRRGGKGGGGDSHFVLQSQVQEEEKPHPPEEAPPITSTDEAGECNLLAAYICRVPPVCPNIDCHSWTSGWHTLNILAKFH